MATTRQKGAKRKVLERHRNKKGSEETMIEGTIKYLSARELEGTTKETSNVRGTTIAVATYFHIRAVRNKRNMLNAIEQKEMRVIAE